MYLSLGIKSNEMVRRAKLTLYVMKAFPPVLLLMIHTLQSTELLIELMEDANITVVTNGTNSFMYLNDLDNSTYFLPEVRIYVLNMYSDNARQLMCAVSGLI